MIWKLTDCTVLECCCFKLASRRFIPLPLVHDATISDLVGLFDMVRAWFSTYMASAAVFFRKLVTETPRIIADAPLSIPLELLVLRKQDL